MTQARRGQIEGGVAVRKGTDNLRAPLDLAQDELQRIVIRYAIRRRLFSCCILREMPRMV